MTGPEHIIAWIESSREHYDRLLEIYWRRQPGRPGSYTRLTSLLNLSTGLVQDAFREMCRCGDAFASDFDGMELVDAAHMIAHWELEQ